MPDRAGLCLRYGSQLRCLLQRKSRAPSGALLLKIREKQKGHPLDVLFVVREAGVEPARPCEHWHLKPASLPIPPLARGLELRFVQRGIYNSIGEWECQGVFQKSFPLKFNPAFLRSGGSRRAVGAVGGPETPQGKSVPAVGTAHGKKRKGKSGKGNRARQQGERVQGLCAKANTGDAKKNTAQ